MRKVMFFLKLRFGAFLWNIVLHLCQDFSREITTVVWTPVKNCSHICQFFWTLIHSCSHNLPKQFPPIMKEMLPSKMNHQTTLRQKNKKNWPERDALDKDKQLSKLFELKIKMKKKTGLFAKKNGSIYSKNSGKNDNLQVMLSFFENKMTENEKRQQFFKRNCTKANMCAICARDCECFLANLSPPTRCLLCPRWRRQSPASKVQDKKATPCQTPLSAS